MNPKVLLLDESLCSLDLKLKKSMQIELKKIQKKLGITFIYVTHAQDEALSMSDRIVVIKDGKIEQIDTPENIYHQPLSIFVADFIGDANILDAKVIEKNDNLKVTILDGKEIEIKSTENFKKNENIKLIIRPENVRVSKTTKKLISGVISGITYSGDYTILTIMVSEDLYINAKVIDENKFKDDETVYLDFDENFIVPLRK